MQNREYFFFLVILIGVSNCSLNVIGSYVSQCMDFGFHQCITRALLMHVNAEEGRQRSSQLQNEQLSSCISALDSRLDKQRFLESNHTAFVIPKKFELRGDEVSSSPRNFHDSWAIPSTSLSRGQSNWVLLSVKGGIFNFLCSTLVQPSFTWRLTVYKCAS